MNEELNQEQELMEEVEQEQEYFSQEEVYDIIEQVTPKVEVNVDEVQGLELNSQEFQAGIDKVSRTCGMISALASVGLTKDQIMDYVINEQNIEFNLKLNQMTCDSNKETARIQQVVQESNQI